MVSTSVFRVVEIKVSAIDKFDNDSRGGKGFVTRSIVVSYLDHRRQVQTFELSLFGENTSDLQVK